MSTQTPYKPVEEFILRTPMFPLGFIKKLTDKDDISDDEITLLCNDPIIRESIYIASPPLYYEMLKWLEGDLGSSKKAVKKALRLKASLTRYFLRMSTRCTPFGLFAGFTTGRIDRNTNIQLLPQSQYIRHTRLDMNYLCALAIDLSKHAEVKDKLKFYPNSSYYVIGDKLRFVEYYYQNSKRTHHIVSVDNSDYLQLILKRAKEGAYAEELAKLLVDEDITYNEAIEFINELVDTQLLVSELDPAVTGDELLDRILYILGSLKSNEYISHTIEVLSNVKTKLENIKTGSISNPISVYENIASDLKLLGTKYELKYLFQTDMVTPVKECTVVDEVVHDIQYAIEVLNKLSLKHPENNLTKFKDAFSERYENEEIPLLHALDTEAGVGYLQNITGDITPLVDDLPLSGGGQSNFSDIKWSSVYALFQMKYIDALADNKKVIELTDDDIAGLETNWEDLPSTVSAMVQVINNSENTKPDLYVKSVGGSSAANLIGRFCHSDNMAHNLVNKIIEKDEALNEEVIFAEIAHLPESRTGNILLRPTLRNYEIPFLAKSSVDFEHQINLDDLYISVKGNNIILRSEKLNKTIVPRLTSAHNFSFNALPVYQFLCDLQVQNLRSGLGFSWGPLTQHYQFLPRVMYKNIILSRATWNIKRIDIDSIIAQKDELEQLESFKSFAAKRQLPREVLLSESDNELYLNLENKTCIKILIDQVKKQPSFTLVEFLFNTDNLITFGSDGGTTNEFVFVFHKTPNKN
jgi:class I lanthipeptide synthase